MTRAGECAYNCVLTRPGAWRNDEEKRREINREKTFAALDFFAVIRRVDAAYKKVKKIEKTFEKGIALF